MTDGDVRIPLGWRRANEERLGFPLRELEMTIGPDDSLIFRPHIPPGKAKDES